MATHDQRRPPLSYGRGETDTPLIDETIGTIFDRTTASYPDHDAVVDVSSGRRWTYRELAADVEALALGLLGAGVKPGDRVGVLAPGIAEWPIIQFACAKLGAILVTINPAYREGELEYVVAQSGASVLVALPEFRASNYAAMLERVKPRCSSLTHVFLIGSPSWRSLLQAGRDADPADLALVQASLSGDEPINIQFTSGTTGSPKGATLSHRNIVNNAYFGGELCRYSSGDRVCVPVPFHHCFGMVMGSLACVLYGATLVIPAPAFDVSSTLTSIEQERCTSLYGVPTMFIAALNHAGLAEVDLSSLRTGIMSGAPVSQHVVEDVISRLGIPELTVCYGMTETSPIATQTRIADGRARLLTTAGRAHPHVEVRVADPQTGETLPTNQPGEVCVRGYNVMLGYWDDPARTDEAIDVEGWMHTGDIGTMDGDGFLAITGRLKDVIIRGGENIYPREIEDFLQTHPDIAEVQVVGVPDDYFGEELCAWVRLNDGAQHMTAEHLYAFAENDLAGYKIPRRLLIVEEFPMTTTGKIQRSRMRELSTQLLEHTGRSTPGPLGN